MNSHIFPHLAVLVHEYAEKYGSKEALIYKHFGSSEWEHLSWAGFSEAVMKVRQAISAMGVQPQENIGIFSQNCAEYVLCDFGAWGVRAVTVPFYATSSEQQIQFMINDTKMRLLFVGEQEQYDKARRMFLRCPTMEHIIVFDRNVQLTDHDSKAMYFDDFIAEGCSGSEYDYSDEDIASILYTSGTTGESKGVILTHGQFNAAFDANHKCIPLTDKDRVLDFLPFAHIFEKGTSLMALCEGATLIINTYPQDALQAMRQMHPTSMSAVPRFWEKVYSVVMERIEKANAVQKAVFTNAIEVGRKYNIDYLSKGKKPPIALSLEYEVVNNTVFSLVRRELGILHPNIFPTAGAAISAKVEEFIHSIGLNMISGYGLTESLATVSCNIKGRPYTIGSVGYPIEGLEIRIGEGNEILLKGPTITPGYYNREDYNREAFNEDGYFRTGDSGYFKDGELFLTERIKDLFKTSNGKYIAPQKIETTLLVDKFIDQIAVIADQHQFVTALIIPEYRLLEEYAHGQGIAFETREDLCNNERVHNMIAERIDTLQQQFSHYEQVKRFTLLPDNFSMERGELTSTLKIRRRVVSENYREIIERMYEDDIFIE